MFAIFKKLAWFFKLRWKAYAIAVSGLIACSILSAIIPLVIGNTVDLMATGTLNWSNLRNNVLILLVIGIVMYGLRYMWRNNLFTSSTLLESLMRNRLFDHFTKMDQYFYNKYRTGDLMAHATNDLNAIKFVAGGGILTLTDSISITIVTLISMFFIIDWQLTLLTIIPFPLLFFVARYLGKMMNENFRGSLKAFSSMNDRVQESVAGMQVIKGFGEEEDDYHDFTKSTDHVVESNRKVNLINSAYTPSIEVITGLTSVLTIFFGTYFISQGRISIGDLMAYFSYLGNLTWPLLAAGRLMNTMERGNVAYDRIEKLLSQEAKVQSPENGVDQLPFKELDVNIESFTYPDASSPALKNIQFTLEDGQTLGIVGKTGSGKTTLFNLLLRHFDIDQGEIKYDGQALKEIDLDYLHENVGYISQTNLLFSTSVANNIRFGRPDMDQDGVEHYAELASIHEDILEFTEGYETEVGERGVSLSGGQKQRISIARTLAIKPDILYMDDAMSAVDAKTEQSILTNFKAERQGGISIIATHRMSSVMHADLIIVLDNGEITERGTHDNLVAENGWYANMYNQQQLERKITEGGEQDGSI
ncbi:ATP-binding cassette domain-containing protein [Aerococcaceae bacterium DSM 111176]|nr:ATP-binding cassette domain-containing protein [Aerococcaceae bacterium DSM 111176]